MNNFAVHFIISLTLLAIPCYSGAVIINPEKHILANGYHSMKNGDDKKTKIYSFTERASPSRISELKAEIAELPKISEIQKLCDLWRGTVKANLIEKTGVALDVVVSNYGYSNSTVACTLKYIKGNKVGTQLIFYNTGKEGLYFVFITD